MSFAIILKALCDVTPQDHAVLSNWMEDGHALQGLGSRQRDGGSICASRLISLQQASDLDSDQSNHFSLDRIVWHLSKFLKIPFISKNIINSSAKPKIYAKASNSTQGIPLLVH